MRKVKFTQDTFDEKIGRIVSEFPILDVSPLEHLAQRVELIHRTSTLS
jgi:hypothetical protein